MSEKHILPDPRNIRTLEDIEKAIRELFKGKKIKVYIFGSRARGDHTPRSDLDLGFLSDKDISYELSMLREILEESNLIFTVDVVDLSRVGEDFKREVIKEGKLWISLGSS